jgi:transcriptional regulator with XRE-family HTH domain
MDIFAKRLRERAKQLGISNAEAARRIGLEERRYAHYASGRREPDLATLTNIAYILGTTPNWLLGVEDLLETQSNKTALIERFKNTARAMSSEELEISVIQAEAIVASKNTKKSGK